MATMKDVEEFALALPETTRADEAPGHPRYLVAGKFFCFHRTPRKDAIDPETGERLDDVLVFSVPDLEVKELLLSDARGIYFTTPHWNGYKAVLLRIRDLPKLDREELQDLIEEAWLARAPKKLAKEYLSTNKVSDTA